MCIRDSRYTSSCRKISFACRKIGIKICNYTFFNFITLASRKNYEQLYAEYQEREAFVNRLERQRKVKEMCIRDRYYVKDKGFVSAGALWIGAELIDKNGNVVPVSYTHLDVYKRQVIILYWNYCYRFKLSLMGLKDDFIIA